MFGDFCLPRRLLSCALLTTSLCLSAHAEGAVELLEKLDSAVRADTNISPISGSEAAENIRALDEVRHALTTNDPNRALSSIEKLFALNQSSKVNEICRQLLREIREERRSRANTRSDQSSALLRKAGEECLRVERQEGLDAITTELDEARSSLAKLNTEAAREASARLEMALGFVELWRKYLKARELPDVIEAKARLLYLANIAISHLMVDRSKLMVKAREMVVDEAAASPPSAPVNLIHWRNEDDTSELSWENIGENTERVMIEKETADRKFETLEEVPPNVTTFHIPGEPPK